MFGRTIFAWKWQHRYVHFGVDLRRELVSVLPHEGRSAQDWMSTQFVGERPPSIACEGQLRNIAAPGCPERKLRVVMIFRCITLLARRLLGANNPDLSWLLRA